MKTIVLKVRNLPNKVDTDLFVYCMQQDVATSYPKGKVELVPEIVRCKDCKYWQDNNGGYPHRDCKWNQYETPDPDDFCSAGERRNDDG